MNAIVEVATPKVVAKTDTVAVYAAGPVEVEVAIPRVATSPLRVVSISGHSISAVAPDHILKGGLATAA